MENTLNFDGVVQMIAVPHNVYLDLHARFDRGETDVFTGKKDGSNRRVKRGADGKIYADEDGDNREVIDMDIVPVEQVRPLSSYGRKSLAKAKRTGKWSCLFKHDAHGRYTGY